MSIGLGTHIHRAAQRHPAKAALIDHGEVISYAEFNERTDRLANGLLGLGLEPGERVAVLWTTRTSRSRPSRPR